jgi:hypothetical protein
VDTKEREVEVLDNGFDALESVDFGVFGLVVFDDVEVIPADEVLVAKSFEATSGTERKISRSNPSSAKSSASVLSIRSRRTHSSKSISSS